MYQYHVIPIKSTISINYNATNMYKVALVSVTPVGFYTFLKIFD